MLGVDWKIFNTDQKLARKEMLPLYGTKRPLLKRVHGVGCCRAFLCAYVCSSGVIVPVPLAYH